jgi:subtilisin family serine protease
MAPLAAGSTPLVVRFKANASRAQRSAAIAAIGARQVGELGQLRAHVVQAGPGQAARLMAAYARHPLVQSVAPAVKLGIAQTALPTATAATPSSTPARTATAAPASTSTAAATLAASSTAAATATATTPPGSRTPAATATAAPTTAATAAPQTATPAPTGTVAATPTAATPTMSPTALATAAPPSDPLYPQQWALQAIGWSRVWNPAAASATVKIAVLDTGVDASHPDLAGRMAAGQSFTGGNPATDPNGHGTAMAGIAAASTNNGAGIAGVAFAGATVQPVQVLAADGTGYDSDVSAGIVWAADNGAKVILLAMSSPTYSSLLNDAAAYAWSRGAVVVAATGNGGGATPSYPAGLPNVLGATATDQNGRLAGFSNSGDAAVAAPGVNVETLSPGGGYRTVSGTSASAAIVAGEAALLLSSGLGNAAAANQVRAGVDPLPGTAALWGQVDLPKALGAALPAVATATPFATPTGTATAVLAAAGLPAATTATQVYGQNNSFSTSGTGTTSTTMSNPYQAAVNSFGDLYVADTSNNRILYFASGSTTATQVYGQLGSFTSSVANNGGVSATSMSNPYGVAVDGANNLYVADSNNNRVLFFPLTGGQHYAQTTATVVYGQASLTGSSPGLSSTGLNQPRSVAVSPTGDLYVVDQNNNRVLFFANGSTTATQVYGQGGAFNTNSANNGGLSADSLSQPFGVAVDPGGNLYIADSANNRELYYPKAGGQNYAQTTATRVYGQFGSFTSAAANNGGFSADSLGSPLFNVAFSPSGDVYMADQNRILFFPGTSTTATAVYGQAGSFTSDGCTGTSTTGLCGEHGVATDSSGNLYVVDGAQNRVLLFPASGTSVSNSTVTASPTSVTADGVTTSTITVTLLDSSSNPVAGDTVILSPSSGASIISAASGPSDASGQVTFTVHDSIAELVAYAATDTTSGVPIAQTASVTFTPGVVSAGTSTVTAAPGSVAADGVATSTITVTLKDANGNAIPGKTVTLAAGSGSSVISAASGPSTVSGIVTFTVHDAVAEALSYTATDSTDSVVLTQTAAVIFTAGAVNGGTSTVTAAPASVAADGTTASTITVTLKDANGNGVSGKTVTLAAGSGSSIISAASGPSTVAGVVTFSVTDTVAESVTYTATDASDTILVTQTAAVTFQSGAVSSSLSMVAASPASVLADGTSTSTITVTLNDSNGNPVSGKTVTLAGSGSSTISAASGPSTAAGVVTFTVRDSAVESATYTATDTTDSVTLILTASVSFTAGPVAAQASTVAANPSSVNADGTVSTVSVTLNDGLGHGVSGKTVTLTAASGSSAISPSSAITGTGGLATFGVKDTTAESVTYTATDVTDSNLSVGTATVTFVSGATATPTVTSTPAPSTQNQNQQPATNQGATVAGGSTVNANGSVTINAGTSSVSGAASVVGSAGPNSGVADLPATFSLATSFVTSTGEVASPPIDVASITGTAPESVTASISGPSVVLGGNVALAVTGDMLAGVPGGKLTVSFTANPSTGGPATALLGPGFMLTDPGSPGRTILGINFADGNGNPVTSFPSKFPIEMKYNATDVGQAQGNASKLTGAYVIDALSPPTENPLGLPIGAVVLFPQENVSTNTTTGTVTVLTQVLGSTVSVVTNPVGYVQTTSADVTEFSSFDPNTSQSFGTKAAQSYLQVVEPPIGNRLLVLDPDTGNYSYVNSTDVAPSGPPPARSSSAVVRGLLN